MITKEMLKDSSSKAKYLAKVGQPLKIVLDPAEVQFALSSGKTSVSVIQFRIDERRYFFYTDDYVNGKGITWGPGKLSTIETVPSTTQVPHLVTPRQGLILISGYGIEKSRQDVFLEFLRRYFLNVLSRYDEIKDTFERMKNVNV